MLMPAANSPLPPSGGVPSSIVCPTTATVTIPSVSSLPPRSLLNSSSPASVVLSNSSSSNSSSQKDTTHTKLFVGGLPYHTTDKSLREHFEVFGEIEEAVVITDRTTGKSRGYGFVIMQNKDDAERACKEPNPIIDGRKANVNLAFLGAKPRIGAINGLTLGSLRQYPTLLQGHIGLPHNSAAANTANPYLHSLYAAPYALQANQAGLISLAAAQNPMAAATASTGNPLLDAYASQYAAALAAAVGYPVASMNGIDAASTQQAAAGLSAPGNYIHANYAAAYAPLSQIPTAAAYGAPPTVATSASVNSSNVAVVSDARIQ
eukprot:TRINITY_DN174_c1_g1_i7.p1 TRINITY_DN174_c1_g1~~TRINITY_DN174_c1_g1_i7.p1  ORF type:complete len:320 (+),score=97.18 TRINITY_DN174_c1_g1_i7:143-1102(+)